MTEHFLIIGNGRTGSTWLVTSLDRFPDVRARGEIKLRLRGAIEQGANHYISTDRPIGEAIDNICIDPNASPARIFGSKLIFDPYEFCGPEIFDRIAAAMGDVRVFVLKRNYLDCWLSWKARGVYHEVDRAVLERVGGSFQNIAKREASMLVLHHGGGALSSAPENSIAYPLVTAIDDLLMFFNNDILSLGVAEDVAVLDYAAARESLVIVADRIGSAVDSDALDDIVNSPVMRKLPGLESYLRPRATLAAFADVLDRAFWSFASGGPTVCAWRDQTLRLTVPGLAELMALHQIPVDDGGVVNWNPLKPIAAL